MDKKEYDSCSNEEDEDYIIQGSISYGGIVDYSGGKEFFEEVLGGMSYLSDEDLNIDESDSSSSSDESSDSNTSQSSNDSESPFVINDANVESDNEESPFIINDKKKTDPDIKDIRELLNRLLQKF